MVVRAYFNEETVAEAGLDPTRFPRTPEEVRKAEETIKSELNKLSLEEHEKIVFDVHGIPISSRRSSSNASEASSLEGLEDYSSCLLTDESDILSSPQESLPQHEILQNLQKIDELEAVLDRKVSACANDISKAYSFVKSNYPKFVEDEAFRLRFLRSSEWNIEAAADAMLQHFRIKSDLFGMTEILGREVQWADLPEGAQEILSWGNMQLLPTTDAAGRTVLMYRFRRYDNPEDLVSLLARYGQ